MSEQVIQLLRGNFLPGAGGYQPGSIIRYTNIPRGWELPQWVVDAGAVPYAGPLPANAAIVNVEAELRKEREDATPTPPKPALRLEDLKKRFGWTRDEQATEGIILLNLPGFFVSRTDGAFAGETEYGRWQQWHATDVDRAVEIVKRVFPAALPRTK